MTFTKLDFLNGLGVMCICILMFIILEPIFSKVLRFKKWMQGRPMR